MQEKVWKPLVYRDVNYGDTFEVSNYGEIRNHITGKKRKLSLNKQGYLYCVISRGRKKKIFIKAHRAVAENFVEGDKKLVINHKDCNKTNNYFENLEFVTVYENNLHARENNLVTYQHGCENHNSKFCNEDILKIRSLFENEKLKIKDIAEIFNTDSGVISRIVRRKSYKNI